MIIHEHGRKQIDTLKNQWEDDTHLINQLDTS